MLKFRTFSTVLFLLFALLYVLINVYKFSRASSPGISVLQEIGFSIQPIIHNFDTLNSNTELIETIAVVRSKCSELQSLPSVQNDSLYVAKATEVCKIIEGLPAVNSITYAWEQQETYERLKRIHYLTTSYVNDKRDDSVFALFIENTGRVIESVFSWPFIIFLIVLYLAIDRFSVKKFSDFLHPFKSIQLFGAAIELGEKAKSESQEAIKEFRDEVRRKFAVQVRKYELQNKVETVYMGEVKNWFGQRPIPQDFRMTIHVPDLLFDESLYQLTDYYPAGSGKGRIFSIRYGIIGLAWRLARTQINGDIPVETEKLIENWGMTKDQANAAGKKRSMAAIYIKDKKDGTGLGILYMDSANPDIFGKTGDATAKSLEEGILAGLERAEITSALKKLKEDLSENITEIRIYEN